MGNNNRDPNVDAVYKHFNLADGVAEKILNSFTPEQKMLLHNMRTEVVNMRLNLQSDSPDFYKLWNQTAGQLFILTQLIGD